MHRRPLGRGRPARGARRRRDRSSAASCRGGTSVGGDGLPAVRPATPSTAAGILVFFVALATLALLTLPYAAGDVPVALDRWLSFVILVVVGWLALAIRVVDLWTA